MEVVKEVCDEVLVVGKGAPKVNGKGIRWVVEPFKEHCPLFGIETGLREAKGDRVLIVQGDSPLLRGEVLKLLKREFPPAYLSFNGKEHYLMAVLKREAIFAVWELLRKREYRIKELHRKLKSRKVPQRLVEVYDYKGRSFINLNTKSELQRALEET